MTKKVEEVPCPGIEFWQCQRCRTWYHYAFADCLCDGHKGEHTAIDVPADASVVGDPRGWGR